MCACRLGDDEEEERIGLERIEDDGAPESKEKTQSMCHPASDTLPRRLQSCAKSRRRGFRF